MSSLRTVIAFTVGNKMRSKAFLVTSLIIAIIVSLGINSVYVISKFQSDDANHIGVIVGSSDIIASLQAWESSQEEASMKFVTYDNQGSSDANEKMLKSKIADDEIEGYLTFGELDQTGFPTMEYKSEKTMDFGTVGHLQSILQQIKIDVIAPTLGLTSEQIVTINAPVSIEKVQISTGEGAGSIGSDGKTSAEIALATGMVYVLVIILFIGVMASGQLIATEITAEKSSRVMEILVTSVSPLTQMFGKIFGMFIVGISQLLVFGIVAAVNLFLPHNRSALSNFDIDITKMDPMLVVYAIIFYLLGYFIYATLYAGVGSIVSRTEDLGQAIMPVTFLSMIGYFIAIFGLSSPDSTIVVVTSFIPFFTPFIMFLRIGTTDPAIWEVWLSIGLMLITIFACGWLSAKIYRTGVLMYGKRPSWKELRKAMKAYKI